MRFRTATLFIASLFVLALVLELAMYYHSTSGDYPPVWGDEAENLRNTILGVFAIPLGTVFGGAISTRKRQNRVPWSTVLILAAGVLVWNWLAIMPVVQFTFHVTQKVASCLTDLQSVSEKASFLITGALAYFFGSNK
jgi:hypothetical protein